MLSLTSPLDPRAVAVAKALEPRLPRLQAGESLTHTYRHWIVSGYDACVPDYNLVVDLRNDPSRWNVDIPVSPRLNAVDIQPGATYAAHTYHRNSHAVGISVACMGGTDVSPTDFGSFPLQLHELETMLAASAALHKIYGIPLDAAHSMTHGEAAILDGYFITDAPADGITRWDLGRPEARPEPLTKAECVANGDLYRARIGQYLKAL